MDALWGPGAREQDVEKLLLKNDCALRIDHQSDGAGRLIIDFKDRQSGKLATSFEVFFWDQTFRCSTGMLIFTNLRLTIAELAKLREIPTPVFKSVFIFDVSGNKLYGDEISFVHDLGFEELSVLNICCNELTSLGTLIKPYPFLTLLKADNNHFNCDFIFQLMLYCPCVYSICLGRNDLGDISALKNKDLSQFTYVDFTGCHLDDKALKIMDTVHFPNLEHLDLSYNNFTAVGIRSVIWSRFEKLEQLHLVNTNFNNDCARALAECYAVSQYYPKLFKLVLDKNKLTQEGYEALRNMYLPCLTYLSLDKNARYATEIQQDITQFRPAYILKKMSDLLSIFGVFSENSSVALPEQEPLVGFSDQASAENSQRSEKIA